MAKKLISSTEKGKTTRHKLSPYYNLFCEIDFKIINQKSMNKTNITKKS